MSEDRSRISLRIGGKRKSRVPLIGSKKISGPISAPVRQDVGLPPGAPPVPPVPDPRRRPDPPAGGKVSLTAALIRSLPPAQLTSSQTSDLVKRRYSTRFNNNPPPSFDTPVPRMPNVAAFEAQVQAQAAGRERDHAADKERSRSRGGDGDREARPPPSRGGAAAPPVDMKALRDPDLNADQCKSLPRYPTLDVTDAVLH